MNFHCPLPAEQELFGKLITELEWNECRYAVREDDEGRHLFCAAVTDGHTPYCQTHQAIAWREIPKLRGCAHRLVPILPALPAHEGTGRFQPEPVRTEIPRSFLLPRDKITSRDLAKEKAEREAALETDRKRLALEKQREIEAEKIKEAMQIYRAAIPRVFNIQSEQAPPRPSISLILAVVSAETGVSILEIKSIRRVLHVARARQIAYYIAKIMTPFSFPEIGRRLGGRDHTSVLSGCRKIASLMQTDSDFAKIVNRIIASIDEIVAREAAAQSPASLCAEA